MLIWSFIHSCGSLAQFFFAQMGESLYRKRIRTFVEIGENRNCVAVVKFYFFFRDRVDVHNAVFFAGGVLIREAGKEKADERIFACVMIRVGNP
jgi:hypothetical protein